MNLTKLFEMQYVLDNRIVDDKGLEGKNLLEEKFLALQVELGELANELPEVFKYWSNKKNNYKKALEEYCDCLHFILSIGNDLGFQYDQNVFEVDNYTDWTDVKLFNETLDQSYDVRLDVEYGLPQDSVESDYFLLFKLFLTIGYRLGFTWEQIEQAYMDKNKVNHERQQNGY